jgi:hypothetical protein
MKILRTIGVAMLGLVLVNGIVAAGELDWPVISSQTKPWSRWWWLGNIGTKQDFTTQMERYARAGLGGLEITPIYGVRGEEKQFRTYLSPDWMDLLDHVLDEGQRLGLGIDMATGNGWPFGGPWVTPDFAARHVVTKTYTVAGGARLTETVTATDEPIVRVAGPRQVRLEELKDPVASNANLQDLALDQVRFPRPLPLQALIAYSNAGGKIDLTSKVGADGRLDWTAPAGTWTLYAVFLGWHGKQVERAGPGGEGDVIDHFSADALQRYLRHFDQAFAGHRPDRLRAYFNDSYEVDDASGESDWTPAFFDEFKRRRGYDLRDELPAFVGRDTPEKNARVRSDHRETISDLLLEKFTQGWAAWAASHHALIRNQAHGSPANILDLYAASGIPETEGANVAGMKLASSAAHVTGKPLASAEVATWLGEHWSSTLGDIKRRVDLTFLGGVNHICYHGTAFSPPDEPWPGHHFYASVELDPSNSIWADFDVLNRYGARVQSFLQAGRPANDVLLYYPVYDEWARRGDGAMPHFGGGPRAGLPTAAGEMLNRGYTFDYVSDRLLMPASVTQRGVELAGNAYRTIVVSETDFMPAATMRKLRNLADAGATIVFHRTVPSRVPGWGRVLAHDTELAVHQEDFKPGPAGIGTVNVGRGRMLFGDDLGKLLAAAGVARESLVDRGLRFERRRHDGGYVYFLVNEADAPFAGWLPVATPVMSAAVFDPMSGERGVAAARNGATGEAEVYVELAPGATCLVKTFASERVAGPEFLWWNSSADAQRVEGPWSVTFVAGGPERPHPVEDVRELTSWTEFGAATAGPDSDARRALQAFAGTAVYRATLHVGAADDYVLDLGTVADSARVRVNGREIAALIAPPWRAVIRRENLRDGDNELEVVVTNLSANRIADLDRRDPSWKHFYNANYPARLPGDRGPDGNFTAAKWSPRASGLLGPVTVRVAKKRAL